MAFVSPDAWNVTFTFQDNNENSAPAEVKYPATGLFADVQGDADTYAAAFQAVSDAALVSYNISRTYVNDAPPVPPASSEVERKLYIPLGTATRRRAASVQVPSPIFALDQNGTDIALPTNAALIALIDLLTNGRLGPGNGIVTVYGDDITRAGAAVIRHRTRKPRT